MRTHALKVAMVVGEPSGDVLGAGLIANLKNQWPELEIEGVLGPELLALGGQGLYDMERLAVMGLWEPLGRLPELWRMRRDLIKRWTAQPPDIFIGVDAPDFNLRLELALKQHGIKTVHFVSPSVWAWRTGRVHLIKRACDLMLCLLPFEAEWYRPHQVPAQFVGHPFADEIALDYPKDEVKAALGFDASRPLILLMPGSRRAEFNYMAPIYLETARRLHSMRPELQFLAPLYSDEHASQWQHLALKHAPNTPIKILTKQSRLAMQAADAGLITSGTATLEMMLHHKPMVVCYKIHPLSYALLKRLVKVKYIALPNLLGTQALAPEYLQQAVKARDLSDALLRLLEPNRYALIQAEYRALHLTLKQEHAKVAAEAIGRCLKSF